MTDQLVEPAESAADALTALVAVTDEGLRGTQAGLGRVADGLSAPLQVVVALPDGMALKGDQGKEGETGAKGDTGAKGATGATGPKGTKGDTGAKGNTGDTGPAGSDGSDGVGTDQLVKVGIDDPRAAFLGDKLEAGPGIRIRQKKSSTGNTLVVNTTGQTGGGGTGGGSAGLIVYDDGVSVGVGNKVSYDGGDPVTISGGIIHVPVGSGAGGTDDQTAAEVPFTPAGGIAATNVQVAIQELDTEKAALASAVMDGDAAGGDLSGTYPNPSVVNDSHSHGAGTAPGAGGELLGAPTTLELVSGVIDVTGLHYVLLDGEGNADDELVEITGGVDGQLLVIEEGPNGNIILVGDPGAPANIEFVNQEQSGVQLGEYLTQIQLVYSADKARWQLWALGGDNIISPNGQTEVIASDGQLYFAVNGSEVARMEPAAVGFFGASAAAQQTIDAPNATPEQIADILIAYGLAVQSP